MGLYRTTEEAATPSTPSSGQSVLYPKTDGLWYWKDDAGVEHAIVGDGSEITGATLNNCVGKGTWTASGTWTLPALRLGGNVTSTGNPNLDIGSGQAIVGTIVATKATAGDVAQLTNGGATPKSVYVYTDNQYAGIFSAANAAGAANGVYFDVTNSTVNVQTASSGAVGVFSGTGFVALGTIKTSGYTVGTLPAGTVGMRAYVTDATAPTYNGALTGGGAVTVPVFYNSSGAWVSA